MRYGEAVFWDFYKKLLCDRRGRLRGIESVTSKGNDAVVGKTS